jgi:hypothetical protein
MIQNRMCDIQICGLFGHHEATIQVSDSRRYRTLDVWLFASIWISIRRHSKYSKYSDIHKSTAIVGEYSGIGK